MFEDVSAQIQDDISKEEMMRGMLDHEMQLLDSLKGGEALASHMEDFYLEALCTLISDAGEHKDAAAVMVSVREDIQRYRDAAASAGAEEK